LQDLFEILQIVQKEMGKTPILCRVNEFHNKNNCKNLLTIDLRSTIIRLLFDFASFKPQKCKML
jgi:hypothetical protein